ncbi:hypothetical protein EMIT0P12_50149 [Pseudomonas sp. IT-P12]
MYEALCCWSLDFRDPTLVGSAASAEAEERLGRYVALWKLRPRAVIVSRLTTAPHRPGSAVLTLCFNAPLTMVVFLSESRNVQWTDSRKCRSFRWWPRSRGSRRRRVAWACRRPA